jgi:hypothetical protein
MPNVSTAPSAAMDCISVEDLIAAGFAYFLAFGATHVWLWR